MVSCVWGTNCSDLNIKCVINTTVHNVTNKSRVSDWSQLSKLINSVLIQTDATPPLSSKCL